MEREEGRDERRRSCSSPVGSERAGVGGEKGRRTAPPGGRQCRLHRGRAPKWGRMTGGGGWRGDGDDGLRLHRRRLFLHPVLLPPVVPAGCRRRCPREASGAASPALPSAPPPASPPHPPPTPAAAASWRTRG
ncbi:Os01g0622800 [Oryza sativa Japonica Group]|uniref:Os01g0622800 protein n=1 Tax=Oryza sativa subsp. japonica TaxID=39947 RepID=B7E880_ORYSJ|nr:unnamed protein product [Oryza sativa Japonica Group]BAS73228.1 Os01g0622800 [Oryza sativa Japonica Group]